MTGCPLVSVVVPFIDTRPSFLHEAVASVFAQTYERWELLLIDDGSGDSCAAVAKAYASKFPSRIRYLTHERHENRGQSAARNLGVAKAGGDLIAFLDSDDVWLPAKLQAQVAILARHPPVAMVFGNSQYWFSWTGDPEARRDHWRRLGVRSDTVFRPPHLLPLLLRNRVEVPPASCVMVRREAFLAVGRFEASYREPYADQVFYAKLCLERPVYVATARWTRYRRHPDSMCARMERTGQERLLRSRYLAWCEDYLAAQQLRTRALDEALLKERWICRSPAWSRRFHGADILVRQGKKGLLRLEEALVPARVRRWWWARSS